VKMVVQVEKGQSQLVANRNTTVLSPKLSHRLCGRRNMEGSREEKEEEERTQKKKENKARKAKPETFT